MSPSWLRQWRVCLPCGRPGFDPYVGKILWKRKWQPTPIFLPGESQGYEVAKSQTQLINFTFTFRHLFSLPIVFSLILNFQVFHLCFSFIFWVVSSDMTFFFNQFSLSIYLFTFSFLDVICSSFVVFLKFLSLVFNY